jgi:dipeptidyl aminopeptidase/acylaminoacyl peptidase
LCLLSLDTKKSRKLVGGNGLHVGDFRWSPVGDHIAFVARPTPDARDWNRGRVYTLDLATLEATPLTDEGYDTPRWSPDGTRIAVVRFGDPMYRNGEICVMCASGGEAHVVSSAFDEGVQLQAWGPEGVYFGAIQRTAIHLFCLDPESGEYNRLTPADPPGWVSMDYTFAGDYSRAAMVAYDVQRYAEVAVLELDNGTVCRLTCTDCEIGDWQLGQHEVIQWTSADGTSIEGVLTKPVGFDPSVGHPLLVVIHGGPSWVSLPAKLFGYDRFYPIHQWVAKGALILQPNYRGSTGYGEAFRALNVRNLGLGDYEDVISGVDALIERGWVDPERVGAMGWSQGGYISAFITTYSDRFKAVSVGAGISNWVTYYVNTDIHPFTRHYLEATPWEDAEVYSRTSPMTYIHNARTPTLIQHGEFDRRVPIPNAYELYQGLQDVGVETKLVVYKGMPHGITKPRLRRQAMQENLDWFNRWIWGEEPEAEEAPPCYVVLGSGAQREDEGELAAIQRFTAVHVQDVYHWARRDHAAFRIFSGAVGLIDASDLVFPGDHALQPEGLSEMAARVAEQLQAQGVHKLVVYTTKAKEHPEVLIGVGCLQAAAGIAGDVTVEHRETDEKNW